MIDKIIEKSEESESEKYRLKEANAKNNEMKCDCHPEIFTQDPLKCHSMAIGVAGASLDT